MEPLEGLDIAEDGIDLPPPPAPEPEEELDPIQPNLLVTTLFSRTAQIDHVQIHQVPLLIEHLRINYLHLQMDHLDPIFAVVQDAYRPANMI